MNTLIIDNDKYWRTVFFDWFTTARRSFASVAGTFEEFRAIWESGGEFDLVIVDDCLIGMELDTLPIIEEIRRTSQVPIIAATIIPDHIKKMIDAGCTVSSQKSSVLGAARKFWK